MYGWLSRLPAGLQARRAALAEGLCYDSMTCAHDRPSYIDVDGTAFLTIPYSTDVNDIRYWRGNLAPGEDFPRYGRDTFEALRRVAQSRPGVMMSIGVHPRILGRPSRIGGLRRPLEQTRQYDGVWLARRGT
jgi:allantoinase